MRPGLIGGIGIAAASVLLAANPAAWGQPPDAAEAGRTAPADGAQDADYQAPAASDDLPADGTQAASADVDSLRGDVSVSYGATTAPDWVFGLWCSGPFRVRVNEDHSAVFTMIGWAHELRDHWELAYGPYVSGPEPYVEGVSGYPDLGRNPVLMWATDSVGSGGRQLLFSEAADGAPARMYRLRHTYVRC